VKPVFGGTQSLELGYWMPVIIGFMAVVFS